MADETRELIQKFLAEQPAGAWTDDSELPAVAAQLSRASQARAG